MLNVEGRTAFTSEHEIFRASVSKFLEREFLPHFDRWEANGIIDRSFWRACGDAGLLCPTVCAHGRPSHRQLQRGQDQQKRQEDAAHGEADAADKVWPGTAEGPILGAAAQAPPPVHAQQQPRRRQNGHL